MERSAHVPRRLALIDASPAKADGGVAHILADLEEALHVYERYSAWAVPMSEEDRAASDIPKVLPVEQIRWAEDAGAVDDDGPPQTSGAETPREGVLQACDAVVLGLQTHGDEVAERVIDQMGHALEDGLFMPGARLCAIVVTDAYEAGQALPSIDAVAALCDSEGLVWSGGLAVGGGILVPAQASGARMGRLRRARSEGIDVVIAAVRSGLSVSEFSRDGSDVVLARCAVPRFVYRRATARDDA